MIVLDEHLAGVGEGIAHWYRGSVVAVTQLRPGSLIKDDAIPSLLHGVRHPTFVTINVTDFWGRVRPDERYCIVCVEVPHHRIPEVPGLVRRLFRLPEFGIRAQRLGKVIRITASGVWFYQVHGERVRFAAWPSG